jgi:hypothetical protein
MEAINIKRDARETIFQCPVFVAYCQISARLGMYFYSIKVSIAVNAYIYT